MILVKPSVDVVFITPGALGLIEQVGHTYYPRNHFKGGAQLFVQMLINNGYLNMLEHAHATLRFICARNVASKIKRHRIGTCVQEPAQYCNYVEDAFGDQIQVVEPPGLTLKDRNAWSSAMESAEFTFVELTRRKLASQIACSVLPDCAKTELMVTANFREWRDFFVTRCAPAAHQQTRELAKTAHLMLSAMVPVVFDGLVK